jgi:RNA polymerase-associated protein
MMVLYSGTTCPYSHRCRFVLFEKGMDFEIRDVDLFAKPEDIALMNPYNEVPILVERDLILYESHIINEYIDERFPHPQLMPGDPVARARVRLFLFNFEKELFSQVNLLEGRGVKGTDRQLEKAREQIRDRLTQLAPIFLKNKYMLGDDFSMLDVAIAPLLWRLDYYEVCRAHFLAPGLHRGTDALGKGNAQVSAVQSHVHSRIPRVPGHVDPALPDPCLARLVHRQRLHPLSGGVRRLVGEGADGICEEPRDRAQHQLRGHQRTATG